MRFFTFAAAAAAALFTSVFAEDIATTNQANPLFAPGALGAADVKAGAPYTIEWSPTAGKEVTLILRKGSPGSLELIQIIAEKYPNQGAFIWTPPTELEGANDYAIQILSEDPLTSNYSPRFRIESNGKGLPKSATLKPTVTVAVTATRSATATYTGTLAKPTATEDLQGTNIEEDSAAGTLVAPKVVAAFGALMAAGMLVL